MRGLIIIGGRMGGHGNETSRSAESVIAAQRALLLTEFGKHVSRGQPYAIVDFPDYGNVGDSAIYLGMLSILRELTGRDPSYVASLARFNADALRRAAPKGPIFLQGGGNFGDIWPKHQHFRESIAKTFPERRLIQAPQSIHFEDDVAIKRCAETFGAHPDFHIMVRDRPSVEFVQERLGLTASLVPDTAFGLGPLPRPAAPTRDIVMLMRTDKEKVALDETLLKNLPDAREADWRAESESWRKWSRLYANIRGLLMGGVVKSRRQVLVSKQLADMRFDRGARILSDGRKVITDRLHAHIMCTLHNIPHVYLDNSYGKIGRYGAVWTNGLAIARQATSAQQAIELLREVGN